MEKFKNTFSIRYHSAHILFVVSLIILLWLSNFPFISSVSHVFTTLLQDGIPLFLFSLGAAIVISTSAIDLSSAGIATFSATFFSIMIGVNEINLMLLIPLVVLMSAVIGCFQGFLITKYNSPPLIISWAFGLMLFKSAFWILAFFTSDSNGTPWTSAQLPETFIKPTIGNSFLIFVFVFLCMYILNFSGVIRKFSAIGANRDTATILNINTKRYIIYAFILAALFSCLGGLLQISVDGGLGIGDLQNTELKAIAVAVLAGTSLSGGYMNTYSIFSASLFFVLLEMIISLIISNQEEISPTITDPYDVIIAVILILISSIFGRKLKGQTQSVIITSTIKSKE